MSESINYGSKYWAITGEGETLMLMADRIEVLPCGALVAWGGYRKKDADTTDDPIAVYGIAAGEWHTFYAASCINGAMVAADSEA